MPKDIDILLPRVMTSAPACPELTAVRFLREAAIDFCRRTRIWKETDSFTVASPDSETVCAIQDASIFEIRNAVLDENKLTPVTTDWLDSEYPNWQFSTDVAQSKYLTQIAPDTVSLYPRGTGKLNLSLVLEPSSTAETLPDFLVDKYGRYLADGALGRLLMVPDKEYSNPQLASVHETRFEQALPAIMVRVAKGQHGARLRTRGQYL